MDEKLGDEFHSWIGRMALEWAIPIEDVPRYLGRTEVENRRTFYPALGNAVARQPVQLRDVEQAGRECWALGERFDLIRFGEFVGNADSAGAIEALVRDCPVGDEEAAKRIDEFIDQCGSFGYADRKTGRLNMSSAALLASTILTSAFPKRFVDFRQTRWAGLAEELDYHLFSRDEPTYGEIIVESGRFAASICRTESFRRFWPDGEPLWTIAGVCWVANSENGAMRPKEAPIFPYEEDFDEGAMVLGHTLFENGTLLS